MGEQPEPADQVPPSAALYAGFGRRDITPPIGIHARNWGAARHEVAEGVHRPLTVTALAVSSGSGEAPILLASLDLGWWQRPEDEWRVRGVLVEECGLDVGRVMVACIHTHAGPSTCTEDADKPGGERVAAYLDQVRHALQESASEALSRMVSATLTWATGRCDLATNRDMRDPVGDRFVCGFNPVGQADDALLVGRITDEQGRFLGTLVNYACHPTTLAWENRLISPDYVGSMREIIEGHTNGTPCLFLQGAAGDLSPREQYTGDPAMADANGRRLGYAVLSSLESMLPPGTLLRYAGVVESGAPLAVWRRQPFEVPRMLDAQRIEVELPLKKMPSERELQTQLETCTDRVSAERLRRKLRVVRAVGSEANCRMPVWIWRMGQSIMVGQPNEAYSLFQQQLRARFPNHAVVVVNLVNGACGYLSPPEMHDLDIYQVWQSPFERGALSALMQACEDQITAMLSGG